MYAVTVEFRVHSAMWDAFLALLVDNAGTSRREEPGCRQFDICIDEDKPAVAFLYEVYDDRAAFLAHIATPHFKAFASAVESMVASRSIITWRRIAP